MRKARTAPLTLLIALIAASWTSPPAWSYPISPVPLWDLVEEADLVVFGDVISVWESTDASAGSLRDAPSSTRIGGLPSIARIVVKEIWKGDTGATIDVMFDPNYICPAPPRYVVGKQVAAFLTVDADGAWYTVGLSYGTLYPVPEAVKDLRDRVNEAVELQSAGVVDPRARTLWHIRAASMRATRWHGLYGLEPAGDKLHYSYDSATGARAAQPQLSPKDFLTIARGFIEEPSTDRTLPMLLALFEDRPHHDLDRALISAIEAVLLRDKMPWWIGDTLEGTLRRLGDTDAEARVQPLGDTYDRKDARMARDVWLGAKRDLMLPDLPAAPSVEIEVPGVGENTPS